MYKKRHARYLQRRLFAQRTRGKVTERTQKAEANALDWVNFYQLLLNSKLQNNEKSEPKHDYATSSNYGK